MLSYRELAKRIEKLPEERKDDSVTIYDASIEEYYGIQKIEVIIADDVLEVGQLVLIFNIEEEEGVEQ